jgi:hypothetical protein
MKLFFSQGSSASNAYLKDGDKCVAQLTFDWTYESIYFWFGEGNWVTINIKSITIMTIMKINIDHQDTFRKLVQYTIDNINSHQDVSCLEQILV